MKKILPILLISIISLNIQAQEIAMLSPRNQNVSNNVGSRIIPVINESHYTYQYMGNDVLVNFNGTEHIEYYENKKYYIKSKIKWISNDECYITIQHSTLPDFPFKKGSRLHLQILKIRNGKVFYRSTLGNRSWEGKMKAL